MPVSILRTLSCAALMAAAAPAVQAEGLAGSYLAGRAATYDSDFAAAALYYTQALARDPQNPLLMENVVFAQLAMGKADLAVPVAERLRQTGARSQVANIVIAGGYAAKGNYQAILDRDLEQEAIHPLVDGLLQGWAHIGAGSVSSALTAFDRLAKDGSLKPFVLYHRALALASAGDYGGAEELFAAEDGRLATLSRRAAVARVQILSQLGRNEDARGALKAAFGSSFDPGLEALDAQLAAGETLAFTIAPSPQDGIAEVFFTLGAALNGDTANDYVLMYARMAASLRPDHVDAILLSAGLLDQLGRYELSVATYKQVPSHHPDYHAAEMGRAEALRRAAKPDAAIEVLEKLARDFPAQSSVYISLGDLLRQQEDYAAAARAYDKALANTPEDSGSRWFLLYARGICHERLDQWEQAEADFRASLALDPNRPQVLNYLGYSLVEKSSKLDEALDMIERAVAARPDSGFIVDSLGWVLYRMGRFDEAVAHMERAVELMPVDPVVNDHLGDVYWAVGRAREAEFQWKRALSFIDPEDTDGEADPERIRRKLEVGLDAVLAEEGAQPLKVANGG
ncbi:tetratricopeptide repeat protein [Leisingera aquaemixtae]|uniref:tetratricopeptide repeat protein n=1 Tax=Leisingera aquaemixtae TaxID=1396826 RepID=UPI001C94F484|nr:tetratricopeptide repeat protein [Leisingera aquaemixtae]MBY6067532.1 tetratricopeptide repeat protein [Leisingera aquaemixtae]